LRILQIYNNYRNGGGGEGVVVRTTTDILALHGHYVRVLQRDSRAIVTLGNKMAAFAKGLYSWQAAREMIDVITNDRPDVVHVHNLYPLFSPSVLVACRQSGIPVVMTVHNFRLTCPIGIHLHRGAICERCQGGHNYWCVLNNCRQNIVESTAYALRTTVAQRLVSFKKNVALFIAPSQFVKTKLIEAGFDECRVVVLPNSSPIPDSSSVPSQGRYVAFVGRISPEKGIETLLGAARSTGLPVRIAGDGPIRPRLVEMSPHNVEFVGFLDRGSIGAFYRGARFAVLPSVSFEPCPLVASEAMSHGLPIIASKIGGLPEIVEDHVTGFLFKPGNSDDLANKMQLLWENPELCHRMGRAGRDKACREYGEDAYFRGLMAAYDKAVETCRDKSARPS
jgi:glycosyltransferase involved in cell wall biosynthesis